MNVRLNIIFGFSITLAAALGAQVDLSKLPPPAPTTIEFDRDIKPIFEKSCFQCHGPERPKSSFRLDQRESVLKGGDNGVDIVPGKSRESSLIHYVAYLVEDMEMPPPNKAPRLTPEEIGLLRAWIDQGVVYGAAATTAKMQFSVSTGLRYFDVSGDERKFREHQWMTEGWAGGLERLFLQDRTTNGLLVTAEARAIADQNDYLLKLRVEKPDQGFIQFGFQQYRRYTDDSGLWYPGYAMSLPRFDSDLSMDIGRSWIDLGLTVPNFPRITLGYEHQYREGEKASLQYDFVTPDIAADPQGRALLPTRRLFDEEVHIVKFDLDHEVAGVRVTDNFRGEFYNASSRRDRFGVEAAATIPGNNGAIDGERLDHFQGANAFTLEKQIKPWLFLSGGYLYSRLEGGAEFDRTVFVPVNPAVPTFLAEDSNGIFIDEESHALSVASLWGPWDGFSIFGAFQNDWTSQNSLGRSAIGRSLLAIPEPAQASTHMSRSTFNESVGIKYTKIPMTVLYADMRLQQEDISHAEFYRVGGANNAEDFDRDTDAQSWLQEYRAGFTVSPWTAASFTANYKHRSKESDYDHLNDTDFSLGTSGNGYPAFIRERDIITDGVEAKLVLRITQWARATLKYERTSTDFHTTTDQVFGGGGGGPILAGNYDAHVYSAGISLSPWQRLRMNTTFTYSQARTISGVNNGAQVVPYEGDLYSVISGATFVLNAKTDLQATYYFSKSDYDQSDTGANTPMGLAYDRHGLFADVTYHWNPNLTTRLQYGFFRYDEPTSGGFNNYTAHAVFATLTYSLN